MPWIEIVALVATQALDIYRIPGSPTRTLENPETFDPRIHTRDRENITKQTIDRKHH
jgi:hypothetical protein